MVRREIIRNLPSATNTFHRHAQSPLSVLSSCHIQSRCLTLSYAHQCTQQQPDVDDAANGANGDDGDEKTNKMQKSPVRPVIDVQTSIRYLQSKAYKVTYGDALVWQPYRRNHKGQRPPEKTRKTCIRGDVIATGNPCPICRDEYLVLHPANVQLLKQFISPFTGEVESYQKTGLCQRQHKNLLIAVQQAWDLGYLDMPLPFRQFDYQEYYPNLSKSDKES
jgi:small subunit ribosomal protein S18b